MAKKHIAILGSTGSIGTQALEVIEFHKDLFEVEVLTTNTNAELLIKQAIEFKPNVVVIADKSKYKEVSDALFDYGVKVYCGNEAICQVVEMETIDIVLVALVGWSGVEPTLKSVENNKTIALANKESLVVAGSLINKAITNSKSNIIPVDSEHSAIFQCLSGEYNNPIEKIILTASGGPFRGKDLNYLENVSVQEALAHPNWVMGKKVTIDSATLMNKGLEVIEAKWLFGVDISKIEVVVHPESIIHSMVQFEDGSIKAQLGTPDMRLPIQYAFSYPDRIKAFYKTYDFANHTTFHFENPDLNTFPCLSLAYSAIEKGGNTTCALNAADEVAVEAFLNSQIKFTDIPKVIEKTMQKCYFIESPDLDDLKTTHAEATEIAKAIINNKNR